MKEKTKTTIAYSVGIIIIICSFIPIFLAVKTYDYDSDCISDFATKYCLEYDCKVMEANNMKLRMVNKHTGLDINPQFLREEMKHCELSYKE